MERATMDRQMTIRWNISILKPHLGGGGNGEKAQVDHQKKRKHWSRDTWFHPFLLNYLDITNVVLSLLKFHKKKYCQKAQ